MSNDINEFLFDLLMKEMSLFLPQIIDLGPFNEGDPKYFYGNFYKIKSISKVSDVLFLITLTNHHVLYVTTNDNFTTSDIDTILISLDDFHINHRFINRYEICNRSKWLFSRTKEEIKENNTKRYNFLKENLSKFYK